MENDGTTYYEVIIAGEVAMRPVRAGAEDAAAVLADVRAQITPDEALGLYQLGGRLYTREQLATLSVSVVSWTR